MMPRRRMAISYFEEGMRKGILRFDLDPNAIVDILYAPIYYRLKMGIGLLSDAYIDEIFDHAMKEIKREYTDCAAWDTEFRFTASAFQHDGTQDAHSLRESLHESIAG